MNRFFYLLAVLGSFTSSVRAAEPFKDVTDSVGLKGLSGSVAAWGDYDNDGWSDLYIGGQLWRNDQGKFTRVEGTPLGGAGIWGDFDNDGFLDIFSWQGGGRLFKNLAGKSFEVVKGLPKLPTTVSLGACWGDLNGDGFLDLYVGGYEVWPSKEYPDVILLNQAGKGFAEHWRQKQIRRARGITAADFDEDGDLDVYVSNYRLQPNLLLQNNGKGVLADVSTPFGTAGDGGLGAWGHTIGSSFGDFDNDGHLDLFVGNFSHPPAYQDRSYFLRNTGPAGKFHFENKSGTAGLRWQESYASPSLADFDNDGNLDLFFTTVYGGDKSVLYRNVGDWKFADVSAASKVDVPTTYQGAWGDYDGDGYLDLVTGGKLFKNPGGKNNWLRVRLDAGKQNTIGSQVRVKLGSKILTRQVEGATGQGNQNSLTLHFGLGNHKTPVEIEVRWPDGTRQQVKSKPNQIATISKPAKP
jgi:enediyne biosynthesis protein E4